MNDKLTPASRQDIEICLSLALTSGRAFSRSQAAETMSKVVAERLVAELEAPGFPLATSANGAIVRPRAEEFKNVLLENSPPERPHDVGFDIL